MVHADNLGLDYPQGAVPPLDYSIDNDQTTWDGLDKYAMSQWMDPFESDVQTTSHTVSSEASISLPPEPELIEMVNIFFDNYFPLLPCISQKRFRDRIDFADQYSRSPLIWAVCAVVCAARSDIKSQASQSLYLGEAKRLLDGDVIAKVMETWLPTTYIPVTDMYTWFWRVSDMFCPYYTY